MNIQYINFQEYDKLIKPIMITTKIISVWPLDKDSTRITQIFRNLHTFAMFAMIITISFATTMEVINTIDDLNEATECALLCTAFYLSLLRVTIYSLHRKDISYIVETMKNDWTLANYEEIVILKDKCLFTFRLSKLFIFSVAFTICIFISAPFIEGIIFNTNVRILPFRGYYFVNHTISPIFEIIYTFNVLSGCFSATTIAGATTFNLVIIMHGSAKFAIIQNRLKQIKGNDRNAYVELSECVKSHQEAITFADTLENVINILVLGQFIISTGLVCFAGFQITAMIEDKARLIKYTCFLNSAILELFLFSYSGNELIDESEAIGYAAYESEWYNNNLGLTLKTIIMRCRIPCKITAAKFYNMSLESFAKVLSTSFSYLTVLQATNEE
ncbi:PREDICTED: odorant receptor 13a-like [Polistes dominula]|uniref:Odorant receptor n=1 Tax=Polistes dominula TaxID=743375 RepID=A0ABM1IAH3_POLDO|nr:PREDICTED: odorant receptor 13a-like [Polistes dominula]